MKSKHYYSPIILAGILSLLLFGSGFLFFLGMAIWAIVLYTNGEGNLPELIFGGTFFLLFSVLCVWCAKKLNFRTLTRLTIKGSQIIWKCPLYTTRKISADEIVYAEIVDMNDHYRLPLLRGDETSFIWLSDHPFPEEYAHKADCVKSKSRYIIFPYTDKVALAISEILPQNKTGRILAFYHRMQQNDYRISQELKRRKKKKRK